VATATSLHCVDMRAQRTARLCAAAVGGGKATDAPSHGTEYGSIRAPNAASIGLVLQ
jgi:hypothetical protein